MTEISVNIIVECSCGNNLSGQAIGGNDYRGNPVITIEPCEKCLGEARNEGYEEGLAEGEQK